MAKYGTLPVLSRSSMTIYFVNFLQKKLQNRYWWFKVQVQNQKDISRQLEKITRKDRSRLHFSTVEAQVLLAEGIKKQSI